MLLPISVRSIARRLLITQLGLEVAPLGLTSARWQILGAIVRAERPQPVAWIARDLGANRQNVQRVINNLHEAGLIDFEPNPHHRRAQLVVLTDKPMYRAPAVEPVPGIRRKPLFTCNLDELRNQSVVTVAMYRRGETHHRRADALQSVIVIFSDTPRGPPAHRNRARLLPFRGGAA
jgi:MarR family